MESLKPYSAIGRSLEVYELEIYDYFKSKYDQLNWRASRKDLDKIKSRFAYMRKIIEADLQEED